MLLHVVRLSCTWQLSIQSTVSGMRAPHESHSWVMPTLTAMTPLRCVLSCQPPGTLSGEDAKSCAIVVAGTAAAWAKPRCCRIGGRNGAATTPLYQMTNANVVAQAESSGDGQARGRPGGGGYGTHASPCGCPLLPHRRTARTAPRSAAAGVQAFRATLLLQERGDRLPDADGCVHSTFVPPCRALHSNRIPRLILRIRQPFHSRKRLTTTGKTSGVPPNCRGVKSPSSLASMHTTRATKSMGRDCSARLRGQPFAPSQAFRQQCATWQLASLIAAAHAVSAAWVGSCKPQQPRPSWAHDSKGLVLQARRFADALVSVCPSPPLVVHLLVC